MDPHTRCFTGSLRRFCLWRDQTSRFPGSTAPIRDVDHIVEYARGGPTTAGNGHGLDKSNHVIRDHPEVAVRALTMAELRANAPTMRWTLPTGHSYDSDPPPALGYGSEYPLTSSAPVLPIARLRARAQDNRLDRLRSQIRRT